MQSLPNLPGHPIQPDNLLIGKVVHISRPGGKSPIPAFITEVMPEGGRINATAFAPGEAPRFYWSIRPGNPKEANTWSFPPRG